MNEFQFIDHIKSKYSLRKIGDDCAVLPKDGETDQLLTTDLLIEEIDFKLEWTTPEFLGHKALAVSLSDIAAMGGKPIWAMVSIGVPEKIWNTDFLDRFYAGWFELANKYGVELVGGDVSRSPDRFLIDSIVGGEVEKGRAVLRSSAKAGDLLCVSGTLGGAAAGLALLQNGLRSGEKITTSEQKLIDKQLKPEPQVFVSNTLHSHNIPTSMIDLSDGLSSDLLHLCNQSNVGARIFAETLPIDKNLSPHFSRSERIDMALHGGEGFELLFTVGKDSISTVDRLGLTRIGEITANVGVVELIRGESITTIEPKGYLHF